MRGEAAERAVAPRANCGDKAGDAEDDTRLEDEEGFAFEVVAMMGTWRCSDGRDYCNETVRRS